MRLALMIAFALAVGMGLGRPRRPSDRRSEFRLAVTWRGHQIRIARGEDHRYQGEDVAGHIIHGARWLAAAAIIGANMNRRGSVSIGALSLARMVVGQRPRRRGRK
jgi:hypothetical protein